MDGGTTRAVDAAVETLFRTKNIVEVRAVRAVASALRTPAPLVPCPPVVLCPPASALDLHHGVQEEAKTRRQIEEKKQQLRHVVGDSYRWVHPTACPSQEGLAGLQKWAVGAAPSAW